MRIDPRSASPGEPVADQAEGTPAVVLPEQRRGPRAWDPLALEPRHGPMSRVSGAAGLALTAAVLLVLLVLVLVG